jgi:prevent-host-death family protein
MERRVSAIKLRRNLGEVMEEVRLKGLRVVVERAGRPMVAMVPLDFYESWRSAREEYFRRIEQVRRRNRGLSELKLSRLVDEARAAKKRS